MRPRLQRRIGWRRGFLLALALVGASRSLAGDALGDSPFAAVLPASETPAGPALNRVELLSGGYDALLVRIHLIRQARRSIDIQTFIWSNDEVGRLMMFELIEAARRGVAVRIIADHLFSEQDPDISAFLAQVHPNLQIKHYRPTLSRIKPSVLHTLAASARSFHAINQRMHSKVLLVDGVVLITGGRNVENAYFDHSTGLNYRDRDVLLIGPAVADAIAEFEQFWNFRHAVPAQDLVDVAAALQRNQFRRYERREDYDFGPHFTELTAEADNAALIAHRFVDRLRPVIRAVFLSDEPGKSRGFFGRTARLTRELKRTLEGTRNSLVMQTPYLVLSRPARALLRDLQHRHPQVRIRLSTNSFASTDNLLAYSGNYRLRNRYVEDLHLEIYEYKPRPAVMDAVLPRHPVLARLASSSPHAEQPRPFLSIHAKSFVIDDAISFVGSFNLDPRSQNLNTEVGLLVEDPEIARQLREEIETDMRPENSWVIGRRVLPLRLDAVNELIGGVLSLSPLDVWPVQNTSSFELRPGSAEVSPYDPQFHRHYREVGEFPGGEGPLSTKEILTRLYKTVGPPLTPIL